MPNGSFIGPNCELAFAMIDFVKSVWPIGHWSILKSKKLENHEMRLRFITYITTSPASISRFALNPRWKRESVNMFGQSKGLLPCFHERNRYVI